MRFGVSLDMVRLEDCVQAFWGRGAEGAVAFNMN